MVWNVKIYLPINDTILLDQNFNNLNDVASETKITRGRVAELVKKNARIRKYNKSPYYPRIYITSIGKQKRNKKKKKKVIEFENKIDKEENPNLSYIFFSEEEDEMI